MADATAVKKATALAADTLVESNDMFIVADAGTAELKRLSWSRVLAGIKRDLLSADSKTITNSGLTAIIYESEVAIRIKVYGTTTAALGTSNAYASFGTIAHTALKPVIKRIVPRARWVGTFRVNSEDNKVQFGNTLKDGSATNIPSGMQLNIDETIMLV